MSEQPRKRLPLRWLTLAEIVGIAALIIAGLGYLDAHRERGQAERARADAVRERQAEANADAVKRSFLMTGTVDKSGDRVRLDAAHPDQIIQTQTVWFPASVRADSVETTGNPRLEAGWIEGGLRKTAGKAKTGRVPVGVLTVYIDNGETRTDRAIYWLGYSLHPRPLRGDRIELEGLSVGRRGVTGDLQAAADALWAAR